jgi:hypothetical protein
MSNCRLFTYLKIWLQSQCFNNPMEVMECFKTWLTSQVAGFFVTGTQKLIL